MALLAAAGRAALASGGPAARRRARSHRAAPGPGAASVRLLTAQTMIPRIQKPEWEAYRTYRNRRTRTDDGLSLGGGVSQ
eukprot:753946-Hanusia_phi.AAC.1